jgi:hypothetical protein
VDPTTRGGIGGNKMSLREISLRVTFKNCPFDSVPYMSLHQLRVLLTQMIFTGTLKDYNY